MQGSRAVRILSLFVSSALAAHAGPILYSVTNLGGFGGVGAGGTVAIAINNSGQVTGASAGWYPSGSQYAGSSYTHAFLYSNGAITDITPTTTFSEGQAINASGQVTGSGYFPSSNPFLYADGTVTVISSLVGSGYGINDAGTVVGQLGGLYTPNSGYINDAFTYSPLYTEPALLGLGGYASTFTGINDAGQIVGRDWNSLASFVETSSGDFTFLGNGLGPDPKINQVGQVTFNYGPNADSVQPFIFSGGVSTQIVTGGSSAEAYGLNDLGAVVGSAYNGAWSAFLYEGGVVTDLNSVIDPSLGISFTDARGINDSGQIIANNGFTQQAYLLTPLNSPDTPEPASAVLLFVGLISIALKVKFRSTAPGPRH
jgi:probable HAF family extracellular repeat protein